jgi:adenine-specific DNA-methyltransferase
VLVTSLLRGKEGIPEINDLLSNLKRKKVPIHKAEVEIKNLYKKNAYDRGITLYNSLDENYKLWGKINVSWPNGQTFGPRYDVLHPKTKKPCKVPERGWRWTKDTFDSLLDYENVKELHDGSFVCGKIWFAKDENTQPSSIKYLEEVSDFLLTFNH